MPEHNASAVYASIVDAIRRVNVADIKGRIKVRRRSSENFGSGTGSFFGPGLERAEAWVGCIFDDEAELWEVECANSGVRASDARSSSAAPFAPG